MKKVFLSICLILIGIVSFAQLDPSAPIERDPDVLYGKLENGLTYYIRHNDKPENRAEYYLLTNVGAIQETYNQSGLAHFLEHMAFNGTKNLPGKDMLNYLQSIGASFGGNINAGTGVEQTSYMLNNIPTTRKGIIDTCLLIMHDYSGFILNDPTEIDKERGVIVEEWRTRHDASFRTFEASIKYLYKGSKFDSCNLIGRVENIQTFPAQELVDFYTTWYRPDLQAVAIVGDIDPEAILAQMKDLFKDIPARVNPEPKGVYPIPSNEEPLVGIVTDPETRNTSIEVYIKQDPIPVEYRGIKMGYMLNLITELMSSMLSERMQDAALKPNSPFLAADAGYAALNDFSDAIVMQCVTKDGKEEALKGLVAGVAEIEKAKRYGFTEAEYNRMKAQFLANAESRVKNAESRTNASFIPSIQNDFFDSWPVMTPEYEYNLMNQIFAMINVDVINSVVAQISFDKDVVAIYNAPQKEGIEHPTDVEIAKIIEGVSSMEIENDVQDDIPTELLDASKVVGSKVVKEESGLYDTNVWTLENGIKVVLRHSDKQKEQVICALDIPGGLSLVEDNDMPSFDENFIQLYNAYSGLSQFSASILQKVVAGKIVGTSLEIGSLQSTINGSSSPKDFETLLQLVYLQVVDPRFNEEEFAPAMNQLKTVVPNVENTPDFAFQKHFYDAIYGNSPRKQTISSALLDKMSLSVFENNYRKLFSNVNGATFYIFGNYDESAVKPLVEKYIGALPTQWDKTKWIDRQVNPVKGSVKDVFSVNMETAKTTAAAVFSASSIEANPRNRILASFTENVLQMLYTDTIREDEGGTYGVGTACQITSIPTSTVLLMYQFDTDPLRCDKLIQLADDGIMSIANDGPKEEYFNNTKLNLLKDISESRITNSYWLNRSMLYNRSDVDMDTDYEAIINSVTPADVQAFVKAILAEGNVIKVQMNPAE